VRAVHDVREAGGATGRVSLITCTSARDVAETLAAGIVNGPLGWLRGRGEDLRRVLSRLRLAPQITISQGGDISLQLLPGTEEPDWRSIIGDAVRMLREAMGSRPVSLVLDEFQRVGEIDPDLPGVFKDLTDELPEVSLVFAGSKRHLMEQMSRDAHEAPLYGVGMKLYLAKIPEDVFAAYLTERARAGGKEMGEDAARETWRLANGIPNDVQLVAFWAYEGSGDSIDEVDVAAALEFAVGSQAVEFQTVFDHLAPSQQRLLKAVAEGRGSRLTAASFLADLGLSSPNAIVRARDALRDQELIERDEETGVWTVSSGLLRAWLLGA
ncbi:MAG: hypothetical protein J2P39_12695, partial [Candidatus Dormibacteraeota bacterium]|nr:hypothetical protein [Candidatus Dormibacteraeota bacterium]